MAQLIKTMGGLAIASVKVINALAIASVKTVDEVDNTASGGGNTYAFVQAVSTLNGDAASLTIASPSITVTAGNLLVIWVKNETAQTLSSVSDGTTTFSLGTEKTHTNNDLHGRFAYLLSGNAGAKTITATFTSSAATFRRIIVCEFSHTAAAVFDTQNTGSGTSTAPIVIASGSITTNAGAGLALGGYSEYSNDVMNTPRVATNAATGKPNSTSSGLPWMWYYITSGAVTGTADCNMSTGGSSDWVVNAIAFK